MSSRTNYYIRFWIKSSVFLVTLVLLLSVGQSVYGATATGTASTTTSTPTGIQPLPTVPLTNPLTGDSTSESIPVIIGKAIEVALGILGGITLFVFVDGAWNWITSAGYPQRVQKGIQTMLFAVAGLFVIFAAYGILNAFISAITTGT